MAETIEMHKPRIRPGAWVRWWSQASGFEKHKEGLVLAYLEPGVDARLIMSQSGLKGRLHAQAVSSVPRYLVRVPGPRSDHFYAPRADVLEAQNPVAADLDKVGSS